jgi:ParB family chromosome partitioning protein
MNSTPKRRLGRGLAALIGDDVAEEEIVRHARGLRQIPIASIAPNPHNPRRNFDKEELKSLAESIRQKGILQPLVVRPADAPGFYTLVAGERRLRAAQMAGLHEVPAVVREMSDAEALEIAIIENVQRADLSPVEEARGYAQLIEDYGYTQQQLAEVVGKSRSHIANTLRLLNLPARVLEMLDSGQISAGHARALITTDDPEPLAQRIVAENLSVREAEALAREAGRKKVEAGVRRLKKAAAEKSPDIADLERRLEEALGLSVSIADRGRKGGRITISYATLEQLEDICRRLAGAAVD